MSDFGTSEIEMRRLAVRRYLEVRQSRFNEAFGLLRRTAIFSLLIDLIRSLILGEEEKFVTWKFIESQNDLEMFVKSVTWDDAEIIEIYAHNPVLEQMPAGATAPGSQNKNVRVLINDNDQSDIELVFDHAEKFGIPFSTHIELSGKVDSIGRIECSFTSVSGEIKAGRLRYRYLEGEGGKAFYLGKNNF